MNELSHWVHFLRKKTPIYTRERETAMTPETPLIIIDSREQTPLAFEHFPSRCGTLQSGDYSLAGHEGRFTVERKSVTDLIGSLTAGRDRFERECHRLRGYDFARLLIVGHPDELPFYLARRKTTSKAILGSLAAFEVRYRLPVVWEPSEKRAAVQIEKWAWYFYREAWRPFKTLPTPPGDIHGHGQPSKMSSVPPDFFIPHHEEENEDENEKKA